MSTGESTASPNLSTDEELAAAGPDGTVAGGSSKDARWRRRLVIALVVLSCLGMLTSTVAVWTHRTLLNTDAWVDAVGPLASDPAVQEATADYLTNQVMTLLASEDLLKEALPPRLNFLATPLNSAVRDFTHEAVLRLMQSEQFQNLWVNANRVGHEVAVNVLRGETRFVQTANGEVSVNLLPLLSRALQAVQQRVPAFLDGRTVPEITYQTPPDEARDQLSQATGRTIPPDFGVISLYQSDNLAALQNGVELFDRVVWVLIVVTIGLGAAAVALSSRRRRTVAQLGIGVALAMGIGIAVIGALRQVVLELITNQANREAAASTLRAVLGSFTTIARILLVLGIITAIVAFLLGDHRWAVAFRRLVGRAGGKAGAAAGTAAGAAVGAIRKTPAPPAFPWLARHRNELLVVGVAVAVLWLIIADATFASLAVALLLLAIYEGGVYLLSRGSLDALDSDAAADGPDARRPLDQAEHPVSPPLVP